MSFLKKSISVVGGTALVIGCSTLSLTMGTIAIARVALPKKKSLAPRGCKVCSRKKKVPCEVCKGERVVNFVLEEFGETNESLSVCPMCDGKGKQSCLNCLGVGKTTPVIS